MNTSNNVQELRKSIPEGLTDAEAFFYANAGFSRGGEETMQEAMIRCAKEMAQAEAWAKEVGVNYEWADCEPTEYFESEEEGYKYKEAVYCVAKLHGEAIASLNGIIESKDYKEAQDYRRVVEAELAEEGRDNLPRIAREYDTKANLFRWDYKRH